MCTHTVVQKLGAACGKSRVGTGGGTERCTCTPRALPSLRLGDRYDLCHDTRGCVKPPPRSRKASGNEQCPSAIAQLFSTRVRCVPFEGDNVSCS